MSKIVGRKPIEIKLYDQQNGRVPLFDSASRLWTTIDRYVLTSGSAVTSGSNTFTGNQTISGSLTVTQGITGSLFGTASYADNAWAIGGNTFTGGDSNRILGTLSNHDLSIYVSGSRVATFTKSGSFILSSFPPNSIANEKVLIEAGYTSLYNLIKATSYIDNYSQFNIQNLLSGSNSSSDVVATADNGTESINYIDMGINSSLFTGSVGDANDAYLYSTGNDLHIGNASNYPVQFFAGGIDNNANRKLQLNPNNLHQMTGSLDVSGSVVAKSFTGSLQGTASVAVSSSYAATSSYADNFTVAGTLTAQTIVAQTITSSIEFITGSTKNGSLLSNTHQFTGSVGITGSLEVNGRNYINDSSSFESRITTNSSSLASFSGSYISESSSFAGRVTTNSSSLASFSGSYINESSSLAGRITTNSSSFVSFSGSYVNESSSLAGRITTNSSSFASFSGSYINESSSFAGRVTTNSSSFVNFSGSYVSESSSFADRIRVNSSSFAGFSGSYVNESSSFTGRITTNSSSFANFSGSYVSESSSFASRITTNSASISTLSASFNSFSGSFMTGSFTGSFTGSISGTSSYATQALTASNAATASSADNFTVRGTLTAQTIVAQTITSSTEYITGSTQFGSLLSNTHQFTGSINVTGSLEVNGRNYITDSSSFASRITTNSSSFANYSGSYVNESASFASRITTNSSSLSSFSSSYVSESSSFASRVTTNSSSFASFSGSYVTESSSFASRIATNSASLSSFSGSYVTESSSFASRITTNSSSLASFSGSYVTESSSFAAKIAADSASFTNFSGSYVNESSSFASRIATNSSSFASFSGSYVSESSSFDYRINNISSSLGSFTSSFSTGSFTGSFTGSLFGTASFAQNAQSASYVLNAISASYATTASNAPDYLPLAGGTMTGDIYAAGRSFTFQDLLLGAGTTFGKITTDGSKYISIMPTYNVESARFWPNGNITIQDAGTYVDNGFRLDVSGSGRFTDGLTVTGSTRFGSIMSNTHQFTGSVSVSGSVHISGSLIATSSITTPVVNSPLLQNGSQYITQDTATTITAIVNGSQTWGFYPGGQFYPAGVIGGSSYGSNQLNVTNLGPVQLKGTLYGAQIVTSPDQETTYSYAWNFKTDGDLELPTGKSITGSLFGTASYAATASSADDFTVRGTLTAQTIVAQTITSSIDFVTGSTKNGSLLTNTHEFTGSVGITGSLAVNGSDYITTSGSASTRLTALESFSGVYSTGSFTGSFNGRVTGSFSGSLYNLQNDILGHIPFFSSSQVLADSVVRQLDNGSGSYSIVINQDNITTAAPEALYVYQPSATSYNVIAGKGNLNSYLQLNIQNTNTGENASSDVVATANNGNETTNYVNMGINSEGFTGSIGDENDAYLYSTGRHLHIGTATNFPIQFFAGGIDHDANRKFQLNPNNSHELTGSLSITNKLNVIGGVTASLQGTASYAIQALSASYWSGSIINAESASYASNADLLDGKDSTIFATTGSNIFKGLQTISGSANISGSVNINGTSPWDLSIMNVVQLGRASVNGDFNEAAISANAYYNGSWKYVTNNAATQFQLGDKLFIFRTGNGGAADSDITWSEKFKISDNGNLLVNNPANNTHTLNVEGTGRFGGSVDVTGSLGVTQGITGSLFGTASYATQALSASYWSGSVTNAATASYVQTAQTASYVLNAISASYASTASYLNPIENSYLVLSQVSQSLNFQDDTEAAAGGVPLGGLYRNGNFILIRIV